MNIVRRMCVPINLDFADIFGRTHFDFKNFHFFHLLDPEIWQSVPGWGQAWAWLGPRLSQTWARLGAGLGRALDPAWARAGTQTSDMVSVAVALRAAS